MTAKITLGQAGRVVIPKSVRDKLQLAPGDTLELESAGETIVLTPVRPKASFRKKNGMWVISTGVPMPASLPDQVLQAIRDERDAKNMGSL